jgi:regulator of protease activity HflC (stomatin/prohibitin superfamily)
MKPEKEITKQANPISIAIFFLAVAISAVLVHFTNTHWTIILTGFILLPILAASIRIADQWEKAVVLRMGKFLGLRGPGIFLIIPIVDRIDNYIDQRIRVTDFSAEKTLTKDTVPVDVDAVVYWTVWDVEKAALEVRRYVQAVTYIAQTGLRDIIGRHELADLLQHRDNRQQTHRGWVGRLRHKVSDNGQVQQLHEDHHGQRPGQEHSDWRQRIGWA